MYRKYSEDHQWRALQKVRNSYYFKLKETKLVLLVMKLRAEVELNTWVQYWTKNLT